MAINVSRTHAMSTFKPLDLCSTCILFRTCSDGTYSTDIANYTADPPPPPHSPPPQLPTCHPTAHPHSTIFPAYSPTLLFPHFFSIPFPTRPLPLHSPPLFYHSMFPLHSTTPITTPDLSLPSSHPYYHTPTSPFHSTTPIHPDLSLPFSTRSLPSILPPLLPYPDLSLPFPPLLPHPDLSLLFPPYYHILISPFHSPTPITTPRSLPFCHPCYHTPISPFLPPTPITTPLLHHSMSPLHSPNTVSTPRSHRPIAPSSPLRSLITPVTTPRSFPAIFHHYYLPPPPPPPPSFPLSIP